MTDLGKLNERVSAARQEVEARGETFYPGPSRIHLASFPPKERWDDWGLAEPLVARGLLFPVPGAVEFSRDLHLTWREASLPTHPWIKDALAWL